MIGTPIKDADLAIRTPWFWANVHPANVGWYEARYWSDRMRKWSDTIFRYWDGTEWESEFGACDFGRNARDQWRGRVSP